MCLNSVDDHSFTTCRRQRLPLVQAFNPIWENQGFLECPCLLEFRITSVHVGITTNILPLRAVRLFQSRLSQGGLAMMRPVRSDTLTLSPFSVYRYDTSVGLLRESKNRRVGR